MSGEQFHALRGHFHVFNAIVLGVFSVALLMLYNYPQYPITQRNSSDVELTRFYYCHNRSTVLTTPFLYNYPYAKRGVCVCVSV